MDSPRCKIITPSQYDHERNALDFVRAGLPDHDPYRAWTNFEFQTDDGAIYEVDLLVLTKQGFWLVECKAWNGRISGDVGTWNCSVDGKYRTEDNPVLLANRKAKALSSLLKAQVATATGSPPTRTARLVRLDKKRPQWRRTQRNDLRPDLSQALQ